MRAHRPKKPTRCLCLGLTLAVGVTAGLVPTQSSAAADVQMIVLRENGVGSASTAQKYIDGLMQNFSRVNGWTSATGKYHTRRASAEAFIAEAKPSYGFMSLGAYLGLRSKYKLQAVGEAAISGGGEQYYLISKTAKTLEECKGQTLSTNHGGDKRFVDKVIFAGNASLSDFQVEQALAPVAAPQEAHPRRSRLRPRRRRPDE